MTRRLSALLSTLAMLAILTLGAPGSWSTPAYADQAASKQADEPETKDIIVLRSGTVVEGQILSEDAGGVRVLVTISGISAPTTYRMSEILEIQRDIPVVTNIPGAQNPEPREGADDWGRSDDKPSAGGDDKPKVYHFPLEGHIVGGFGSVRNYLLNTNRRDIISFTPVEKTMRDALSYNPDVIIVEMDADAPGQIGWDGGIVTEPLQPLFQEVMDNPDVKVVFWVKNAQFGAAFLPFSCPNVYFTSDGFFGGIGTLDDFDIGDELVNEKQISLRIGAAEGTAIKNGYDPAIVRGMARKQNWLCYRFRHGKVEFLEHEPREIDGEDWIVLTDDGKGQNKDEMLTRGDDTLNLDADIAMKIGVSKGTYDDIDDLIFSLGIRGDYDLIEGRAERNFEEWRDRVQNGLDRYLQLNRDLADIEGSSRNESISTKIGKQRRVLREIRGLLTTYEEVFDPTGQERAGIDIQLEALREALAQANRQEREREQRRGRGRR